MIGPLVEAGIVIGTELTPLATARLVTICSPASAKVPLLFQSAHALRRAAAPVFVTRTVKVGDCPATSEGNVTPSSSLAPAALSPVAAAVGWPSVSVSMSDPSISGAVLAAALKLGTAWRAPL